MPLVIQLVALDALEKVEPVALVRPEGVNTGIDEAYVFLPVILDMRCVERLTGLGRDRSVESC